MISVGAGSLGALFGGLLADQFGLRSVLWLAVIGGTLAGLWLLPSPLLPFRIATTQSAETA
jgi:predicted MFS family arabinose efflux permease